MSGPRTFVVGDLHGCIDELECLLDAAQPAAGDHICFLGDYVDRGPSAAGVIARLVRLSGEGPECTFLRGNHEDMFLGFLGLGGRYGEAFHWNGGDATLASYGLQDLPGPTVADRLPPAHRSFLESLETHAYFGRFFCVHAGVRPSRPLDQQAEEDLLWIRDEFITAPHPFPYTVLYGHTPGREVRIDLPYKVGLDTGLVYGNKLSALELRTGELWQIGRGARQVRHTSLAERFHAAGIDLP